MAQHLSELGLLVAAAAGALLAWLFARTRSRLARRGRARRAIVAEHEAERLLVARGYTLLARQPRTTWSVRVDRVVHDVPLRADLLLVRRGLRFIADVKTGKLAPLVTHAPTRRQLLEYALAYDVDGVLLVDMEAARVHEIAFETRGARASRSNAVAWLVLLGAGAACLLAWLIR